MILFQYQQKNRYVIMNVEITLNLANRSMHFTQKDNCLDTMKTVLPDMKLKVTTV